MNVDSADFFALALQVFDSLFSYVGQGAHGNYDIFSVFSAVVVERFVGAARDLGDFIHVASYDIRHSFVVFVAGFCVLEVNVRVFCSASDFRMIRVQSAFAESFYSVPVDEVTEVFEVHNFNLLDFVRRTETVEEVDERQGTFQSG